VLPDGLFSKQIPSFYIFWKDFELRILISCLTTWYMYILGHLIYFVAIWYIVSKIWQPCPPRVGVIMPVKQKLSARN
jgi:hypothetical protein